MNIKIILVIPFLFLTACFDEGETISPESMEDCIEIKNPNNRDICRMEMQEKLKKQTKNRQLDNLGDGEINTIDW